MKWKTSQKYLERLFATKAGGDFVRDQAYFLTSPLGVIIHFYAETLNDYIQPGATMHMSAVIRAKTDLRVGQYTKCPFCGTLNRGQRTGFPCLPQMKWSVECILTLSLNHRMPVLG